MKKTTEIYSRAISPKKKIHILQSYEDPQEFSCRIAYSATNNVIRALDVTKPGVYRFYEGGDIEKFFKEELKMLERFCLTKEKIR